MLSSKEVNTKSGILYIDTMRINNIFVLIKLHRKLRKLENARANHLYKMICTYPASQIEAIVSIESLDPIKFAFYDRNITRYQRLIIKAKAL